MKRLLIFVNKFDENDDLLGFFVGWVRELTGHLESVIVITQHIGRYEQITGLRVILIDKEKTSNQIARAIKFIKLLFKFKNDYDGALIIMAPAWAIMASFVTKILGKKLYLWYAVWRGSCKLRLAEKLVNKIFCSVPEAFPFKTTKLNPIGQGIDTDSLKPDEMRRKPNKVLCFGRISPIKKIDIFLKAIWELKKRQPALYGKIDIEIAGGFSNASDEEYAIFLKKLAAEFGISEKIKWSGRIPHSQAIDIFQEADVVVNMTPTGSFDKAMLEAMACGSLLLSSNRAWLRFFDSQLQEQLLFRQDDSRDLAQKLVGVLNLDGVVKSELRQKMRNIIIEHHSQKQWAHKLIANL